MRMRIVQILLCAVVCGCVIGCGRDGASGSSQGAQTAVSSDGRVNPLTRADADVLVVVNGLPITCGDFKRRSALERIFITENLRKHKARLSNFEERVDVECVKQMRTLIPRLVNDRLVGAAMKKEGVVLPPEKVEEKLKSVCRSMGVKKGGVAALAEKLGVKDVPYLQDELVQDVRHKTLRVHYDPGSTSVSEQEIDEGLERQNKWYARAVASNAVTYATCSNVMAQISAGMDFAAAGRKYGMVDPENVEDGEEFDLEDFETDVENLKPHLRRLKDWALSAKVGSVSGPWEMEDGLSIVKILSREDGVKDRSVVSIEEEAEVTLARITFEMLVPEPEPRTREFVRESLLRWKADKAQREMFEKLHADMKLDYLLGTNFNFEVVKEK